jgi:hypothetical protein
MRLRLIHVVALSIPLAGALGCHGKGHDPRWDTATPQELCHASCLLLAAPPCVAGGATDWVAGCEVLCLAEYTDYPECTDSIRAVHICEIERMHYGCDSSGGFQATPEGACRDPILDCLSCTHALLSCA